MALSSTREAVQAVAAPRYPYDRVTMTHELERVSEDGSTYTIVRPVARNIDEAIENRMDYYHPGGELRDKKGRVIGTHEPDWFLWGHKWQKGSNPATGLILGGSSE